jgi:excisionase family DNA binding protein
MGGGDRRVSAVRIASPERRPFFTPKALAAYLSISERTVRDMLSKHRIPSYRVEGERRIDPEDVDVYLARHRDNTT